MTGGSVRCSSRDIASVESVSSRTWWTSCGKVWENAEFCGVAVRRSSRRWLKEIAQKGAMKAILLREPGKFEQVQIAETVRPGSGDALVRVHRVGICGTDISGYPDPLLHRREITIYASRNAPVSRLQPHHPAHRGGSHRHVPVDNPSSQLHRPHEAFPSYTRPETGVIKAMIDVS